MISMKSIEYGDVIVVKHNYNTFKCYVQEVKGNRIMCWFFEDKGLQGYFDFTDAHEICTVYKNVLSKFHDTIFPIIHQKFTMEELGNIMSALIKSIAEG